MHAGLEQQQAALHRRLDDRLCELAGASCFVARILDELEREHRAEAADVADRGEALLPGEHARGSSSRRSGRALERFSSSITSRTATAAACATGLPTYVPPIGAVGRRVHDRRLAEHAGERQPAGDRLLRP